MNTKTTRLKEFQAETQWLDDNIMHGLRIGGRPAWPFVRLVNRSVETTLGVHTLIQLVRANRAALVKGRAGDGDEATPMFSEYEEDTLLGLAEAALWMLGAESDLCEVQLRDQLNEGGQP